MTNNNTSAVAGHTANAQPQDLRKMFCFQCEQTKDGKGCTMGGVCGKSPAVAEALDMMTGAAITLARIMEERKMADTPETSKLFMQALFTAVTNVNFNVLTIDLLADRLREATLSRNNEVPAEDFDMSLIWDAPEDIRSLKSMVLFGLRGMAAYATHAALLGYVDGDVCRFIRKALASLAQEDNPDKLFSLVTDTGKVNFKCMELLDRANTETFGTPVPTEVTLAVEPGPFIVVTGHDLLDLKQLLEQAEGKGVNIYTHGEMLPAHAYPKLKAYKCLKGHFGTAWQNQQKEFDNLPAPILWTTNCLMLPRKSYSDRVWTTGVVSYPGAHVIRQGDAGKDFSCIISQAKVLGGWKERELFPGINGGTKLITGFGHEAVLSVADKIVDAVKNGKIRHFFLVGGCDGARPGRSYYTDFVKATPPDTIILTLACGKFRFNDLNPGTVAGLPRIMDVGQCNDAYGAVKIVQALAQAFNCEINELPISLIISWYEQKAVCVLLSLLALGIKDIRLGPSLPAFISPNILKVLQAKFRLKTITTPEEDLKSLVRA